LLLEEAKGKIGNSDFLVLPRTALNISAVGIDLHHPEWGGQETQFSQLIFLLVVF
jgi:hypothetical protein